MAKPQLRTAQQQEGYQVLTWHHSFWHILYFSPMLPLSVATLMHLQKQVGVSSSRCCPNLGQSSLKSCKIALGAGGRTTTQTKVPF